VQGEVHRLRGAYGAAEEAYREASGYGRDPHPGLALLRLAQGDHEAAGAAIRRAVGETSEPSKLVGLLPAQVEIMLAVGDAEAARRACLALEELGGRWKGALVAAMVSQARGAVDLAEGDAQAALVALRHAGQGWRELDAPYEAALARVLVALACARLGDDDTASLELEAAREVFARLGAAPDLARVDALTGRAASRRPHGLTARELQVLRLVAAGETNKAIAAELVLSQRTVDRHVSNIFAKLGVSSRAAATAYAYEHRFV
jgi:DNA-binding NarL/FixJ family response regulator